MARDLAEAEEKAEGIMTPETTPSDMKLRIWECKACGLGPCEIDAAKKPKHCAPGLPVWARWKEILFSRNAKVMARGLAAPDSDPTNQL